MVCKSLTFIFLFFSFLFILPFQVSAVEPMVAAGYGHTLGLKSDGTVEAVGWNKYGQCNVSGWANIRQIAAGSFHAVGLKADGTVVAVGDNSFGQCEVSGWENIVQVAAGWDHTVGLKSDGTVVAIGRDYTGSSHLADWTRIRQVAAGSCHTLGLKPDGTVAAYGLVCDISCWTNIKNLAVGKPHTVGLKSDGTVAAVGLNNDYGQLDVADWDLGKGDTDGDGLDDVWDPVCLDVEYLNMVQEVYIAYYLRPPDPGGLYYWAHRLEGSDGDMSAIIEHFADSDESFRLWGGINSGNIGMVVDDIYQALFDRAAEEDGKKFYVDGFKRGEFTAGTIVLNILDGAKNEDAEAIESKLEYCTKFVHVLDPDGDYQGPYEAVYDSKDEETARDLLAYITCESGSISEQQVKQDVIDYIAEPGDPILN